MKPLYALPIFLLAVGCKQPADSVEAPIESIVEPLLKTHGCKVAKNRGVLKVECSDGSFAEAGAPSYHIKDAAGVDLDNLMFLQSWSQSGIHVVNKTSGHVLSFDSAGNVTKLSRVLYTTSDCTGVGYAFISDAVLKNKVVANNGAAHSSVEALKVVDFEPTTTVFQSKYEGFVCSGHVGSGPGAVIVEASEFHDSDPVTISLPIEIVIN